MRKDAFDAAAAVTLTHTPPHFGDTADSISKRSKDYSYDEDSNEFLDQLDFPLQKVPSGPGKAKPGRKLADSEPTDKKVAQQRVASRKFRERKAQYVKELEQKVADLTAQLAATADPSGGLQKGAISSPPQDSELAKKVAALEAENTLLRQMTMAFDFKPTSLLNVNGLAAFPFGKDLQSVLPLDPAAASSDIQTAMNLMLQGNNGATNGAVLGGSLPSTNGHDIFPTLLSSQSETSSPGTINSQYQQPFHDSPDLLSMGSGSVHGSDKGGATVGSTGSTLLPSTNNIFASPDFLSILHGSGHAGTGLAGVPVGDSINQSTDFLDFTMYRTPVPAVSLPGEFTAPVADDAVDCLFDELPLNGPEVVKRETTDEVIEKESKFCTKKLTEHLSEVPGLSAKDVDDLCSQFKKCSTKLAKEGPSVEGKAKFEADSNRILDKLQESDAWKVKNVLTIARSKFQEQVEIATLGFELGHLKEQEQEREQK